MKSSLRDISKQELIAEIAFNLILLIVFQVVLDENQISFWALMIVSIVGVWSIKRLYESQQNYPLLTKGFLLLILLILMKRILAGLSGWMLWIIIAIAFVLIWILPNNLKNATHKVD